MSAGRKSARANLINLRAKMQTIRLDLDQDGYDIHVDSGLLNRLANVLEPYQQGQKWVVITQQGIWNLYGNVFANLVSQGWQIHTIIVTDNESAKSLESAQRVWSELTDLHCDRSTSLIALGGGVVGDLTGFIAATYMRGIAYLQIPTTLLAMIDSAIGGKTALNLPAGKNLVGAVYQPKMVIVDPSVLGTLPSRNINSSLAEAVKYGLINNPQILGIIEQKFDQVIALEDKRALDEIIFLSIRIKVDIVSQDPFEHGRRKLLNYGHTIGHAFETLAGYGEIYHGEAVFLGMKCANYISRQKGLIDEVEYQRAQAIIDRFQMPKIEQQAPESILKVVAHDKKHQNGRLQFILLNGIGNAEISDTVTPRRYRSKSKCDLSMCSLKGKKCAKKIIESMIRPGS